MKRFIVDACLLLVLVGIGAYLQKDKIEKHYENQTAYVEQQIDVFEESVAMHQVIPTFVNQEKNVKENKAAKLAKTSSDVIVRVIAGTTNVVFKIFDEVIK